LCLLSLVLSEGQLVVSPWCTAVLVLHATFRRFDAALAALSKLLTLGQDSCPYSLVMLTMHGRVKQSYLPTKQQLRRQRRQLQRQQQQQRCDVEVADAEAAAAAAGSNSAAPCGNMAPAAQTAAEPNAAAAAGGSSVEELWGSHPTYFRGWGEEESTRVTNTRLRRVLLLHMRVRVLLIGMLVN
jgi:hypothetical protein